MNSDDKTNFLSGVKLNWASFNGSVEFIQIYCGSAANAIMIINVHV